VAGKGKTQLNYFGIRHFGVGCARALAKALRELKPDAILLEMPADAGRALQNLKIIEAFPVAVLAYSKGNDNDTYLFPLEEYSPEWIAICYAGRNQIPVYCIDLPLGARDEKGNSLWQIEDTENDGILSDAFTRFAELQGINDTELWWEINFERSGDSIEVFEEINELMHVSQPADSPRDKLTTCREAWMRDQLRAAVQEINGIGAVVCGAAHLPFIQIDSAHSAEADHKLSLSWKINALEVTWIPWSEQRLSNMNGYASGMKYPAYYNALWKHHTEAPMYVIAGIASFLREKGFDVSPAHSMEVKRLADRLSQLRGHPLPGINEILEAGQAVFNLMDRAKMTNFIHEALVGKKQGRLNFSEVENPLLADFELIMKSLQLNFYRKKVSEIKLELDLRIVRDLAIDAFLHQLQILEFSWATPLNPDQNSLGTFKTAWHLEWQEDDIIRLSKKIIYGHTVAVATRNYYLHCLEQTTLPSLFLANTINSVMHCGVTDLVHEVIRRIPDFLINSNELPHWVKISTSLLRLTSVGSVREIDSEAIGGLLETILPGIILNIPVYFSQIDLKEADNVLPEVKQWHNALTRTDKEEWLALWYNCMPDLSENRSVSPVLRAWVLAQLMISQQISFDSALTVFSQELKIDLYLSEKSYYLKNFVSARKLNELELPFFLKVINKWLSPLDEEQFMDVLPLLRKGFANDAGWLRPRIKKIILPSSAKEVVPNREEKFHPDLLISVRVLLEKLDLI